MSNCPKCRRAFDDGVRFCPTDGAMMASVVDPYLGRVLMGQFRLVAVAGRGAMGTVYRAEQTNVARQVALKVLRGDLLRDEMAVKRFLREATAAARLSHPNIVSVHFVGETDEGVPFIVMEFIEGETLGARCDRAGVIAEARALGIAREIASALGEAHRHGIVHRDLKADNVLLAQRPAVVGGGTGDAGEAVKVLDFGIAKLLGGDGGEVAQLTHGGTIFGTPHYIAPEQATGREVDGRADLYSLGVILFRMVTGRLPFEGGTGMQVLMQHVRDPVPHPRDLRPEVSFPVEQLILTALEKDPRRRFADAAAMIAAIDGVAPLIVEEAASTLRGVAVAPAPEPEPTLEPELGSTPPWLDALGDHSQPPSAGAVTAQTPSPSMGAVTARAPSPSTGAVTAQTPSPSMGAVTARAPSPSTGAVTAQTPSPSTGAVTAQALSVSMGAVMAHAPRPVAAPAASGTAATLQALRPAPRPEATRTLVDDPAATRAGETGLDTWSAQDPIENSLAEEFRYVPPSRKRHRPILLGAATAVLLLGGAALALRAQVRSAARAPGRAVAVPVALSTSLPPLWPGRSTTATTAVTTARSIAAPAGSSPSPSVAPPARSIVPLALSTSLPVAPAARPLTAPPAPSPSLPVAPPAHPLAAPSSPSGSPSVAPAAPMVASAPASSASPPVAPPAHRSAPPPASLPGASHAHRVASVAAPSASLPVAPHAHRVASAAAPSASLPVAPHAHRVASAPASLPVASVHGARPAIARAVPPEKARSHRSRRARPPAGGSDGEADLPVTIIPASSTPSSPIVPRALGPAESEPVR